MLSPNGDLSLQDSNNPFLNSNYITKRLQSADMFFIIFFLQILTQFYLFVSCFFAVINPVTKSEIPILE